METAEIPPGPLHSATRPLLTIEEVVLSSTTPEEMINRTNQSNEAVEVPITEGQAVTVLVPVLNPPVEENINPPPQPPIVPFVPAPRTPLCIVCQETRETENVKFPYKCTRCYCDEICMSCLKDWFLDACKNESKMPPKCSCCPIPVSVMTGVLSPEEIALYRAKFEEYSTPDRLYCPVPSCSAFIPPRLFLAPKVITEEVIGLKLPQMAQLEGRSPEDPSFVLSTLFQDEISLVKKPCVSCPSCEASVCTKCRGLEHTGECSDELDPEFTELLKKWRIKRCPRCRTGVRKVYGCPHVECRCGAHFCWVCLKPFNQCDEDCAGDSEEEDEPLDDDDLDGHAGYFEGDEFNFGDEPDNGILQAWSCRHDYQLVEDDGNIPQGLHCVECFRILHYAEESKEEDGDEVMTEEEDTTKDESPTEAEGSANATSNTPEPKAPTWGCIGSHTSCTTCSPDPPVSRATDASRYWKCECGTTCQECNTTENVIKFENMLYRQSEKVNKELSLAWECRCGNRVCGSCKVSYDVHGNER